MAQDQEIKSVARNQWSSEPAFIVSMTAAAVGLGNLWRFPYIMGQNGGGAFLIAYFVALFIVVLPIMILEVAAGRLSQSGTVQTFRRVRSFGVIYGWFVVLLTMVITSYYLVITGWTLGYAVDAVVGNVRPFEEFTTGYNSLWYFVATALLAAVVLVRGIGAIELGSKILMPILLLVIVGLVVMASRTSGWEQSKEFFFQMDWSRLTNSSLWAAAFGQAFYTLAIGQGYLITYGSYIPRKTNVPRACIIVACFEVSVALLAGWMIFPFLFTFGLEPDAGSQLAFETLPRVFAEVAGGSYLAILFFVLFFTAAFSSSLAGLKVMISAVTDELKFSNTAAVALITAVMLVLGSASALSFTPLEWRISGEPVLDFIDRIAGGNVIIFSGVVGAALFCWFIPPLTIRKVLGTESRWWEWQIYLTGRYLPVLVLVWMLLVWGVTVIRGE